MKKMYIIKILFLISKALSFIIILCLFFCLEAKSQSGLCDSNVPFFNVDLSSNPDSLWVSTSVVRQDNCCGSSSPDRCVEFIITLHPNTTAISFNIASGAIPSGSMYYSINCGNDIPVGEPVCLSGQGPHILTFCKPGNNSNTYQITSMPSPDVSPNQLAKESCPAQIWVSGLDPASISWQDITYGGAYNSYLSCFNCESPTVTPTNGFPPYVDYQVCGTPVLSMCQGLITYCDTVRVYFYEDLNVQISPNPASFCSYNNGVLLQASFSGGVPPYTYAWFDGPQGAGNQAGQGTSLFVTNAGTYSFVVYDSLYPYCSPAYQSVDVTISPNPVANISYTNLNSTHNCYGDTFQLNATGGVSYQWAASNTYISNNNIANPITIPTATTVYNVTVTDAYGCTASNNIIIQVNNNPVISTGNDLSICIGQSTQLNVYANGFNMFEWSPANSLNDSYIKNPIAGPTITTTYYVTVTNCNNCSSIDSIIVFVQQPLYIYDTIRICQGETLLWHGQQIYSNGTFVDTVYSSIGCDSIISMLHIFVKPSYEFLQHEQICEGNIYNWRGNDYTLTGTYYDSLQTQYGCDSVYILNLTLYPVYEFTEHQEICEGDTLVWQGDIYTTSGTYYKNYISQFGCDSMYILQLVVSQSYVFVQNENVCFGGSVYWQDSIYAHGGIYYKHYSSMTGCDSIYILNLNISHFYSAEDTVICSGDVFLWQGNDYSITGSYYDSLQTISGCDSVYMLNLTVLPVYELTEHQEICEGDTLVWLGDIYTTSGTYYKNFTAQFGCDSILVLNLTINAIYEYVTNADICNGATYTWRGNDYSASGTYYDSLQTALGCDSIYVLSLTVHPVYEFFEYEVLCAGNSIIWRGNSYASQGIYYDSLTSVYGCDSIYILYLSVLNLYETTHNASICQGEAYWWRGNNYTTSDSFTDTIYGLNGCDSIFILELTVHPIPYADAGNPQTICFGETTNLEASGGSYYEWGNGSTSSHISVLPSTTTTYTVTVTDMNNCSASGSVIVTVNPLPEINITASVNEGCAPLQVQFFNFLNSNDMTSFLWDFGDGQSSGTIYPVHTFENTGFYTVSLTVEDNNACINTVSYNNVITVHPNPVANFFITEMGSTNSSFTYQFNSHSVNANSWFWEFGDAASGSQNYSTQEHPTYTYNNSGNYTVVLYVESVHGCTDSVSKDININTTPSYFIPNAFTPDGDGLNDYFTLYGENILEYKMMIFNRWGKMIFISEDHNIPWDGRCIKTGKIMMQDVYTYKFIIKDSSLKEHHIYGHVTLVR